MSTYTQILYHIVFATKYRKPSLADRQNRKKLFAYMAGVISNRKSKPIIINGVEDHVHILVNVHPGICIADLVRDIKISTNKFIRTERLFPTFESWQEGYGAFTRSNDSLHRLRSYIANQEIHHQKIDSSSELRQLLIENGVHWDEKYFE
jgi:putative transposase